MRAPSAACLRRLEHACRNDLSLSTIEDRTKKAKECKYLLPTPLSQILPGEDMKRDVKGRSNMAGAMIADSITATIGTFNAMRKRQKQIKLPKKPCR